MTLSPNQFPPQPPTNPLRVLFVEDDYLLRGVVVKFLQRNGYLVETAWDGVEGFRKFQEAALKPESAFDVIITDLRMPRLDGIGLIRLIREQRSNIPTIVYSSSLDQQSLDELDALSVTATLPKDSAFERMVVLLEDVARAKSDAAKAQEK